MASQHIRLSRSLAISQEKKEEVNTYDNRLSVLWSSAPYYRRVLPRMWQANRKRLHSSSNARVRFGLAPQANEGERRASTTTRILLSEHSADAFSGAKSSSS